MAELHGFDRLGQAADLVDLDQDRIGNALVDPLLEPLGIGDEQVVADELDPSAELVGQRLPAVPIVFRHPVLDRRDRVIPGQISEKAHHFR